AGEGVGAEVGGLGVHAFQLVGRYGSQHAASLVPGGAHHDEVPQPLQQVLHEATWGVPGVDHTIHHPKETGAVAGGDRLHGVVQQRGVGEAQESDGSLVVDRALVHAGDELIEHREAVAYRPSPGTHHQGQYAGLDLHTFGLRQGLQVLGELFRWHQTEGVMVRAGTNRADDLLRLGGCEYELHVRRRLFDKLEQGVEALRGDHMGLVDDEVLVAVPCGAEDGAVTQLTTIVRSPVGGGVHLHHIEGPATTTGKVHAAGAGTARGAGGAFGTVE